MAKTQQSGAQSRPAIGERQQLCDAPLLPKGKVKSSPPSNEGVVAVRDMELGTTDGMSTCTLGLCLKDVCKISRFLDPFP